MSPLPVPVWLVSEADLLGIGGKHPSDYWARFYDRYPDSPGYLIFSRPGYSHDGHRASCTPIGDVDRRARKVATSFFGENNAGGG
ncbi:MAG: hypothetical protein ACT4PJ_13840 [Gemmatimonadaceae bacterium]